MSVIVFALWIHDTKGIICDPYAVRSEVRHQEWFWACRGCLTAHWGPDEAVAREAAGRHACPQGRIPGDRWTPREDALLAAHSVAEVAALTGRTVASIHSRRRKIKAPASPSFWGPSEVELLRRHGPGIYRDLGRTLAACRQKASRLGITAEFSPRWTPDEDAFLLSHTGPETAAHTGRTLTACRARKTALRERGQV